jgi:hypothetical protein
MWALHKEKNKELLLRHDWLPQLFDSDFSLYLWWWRFFFFSSTVIKSLGRRRFWSISLSHSLLFNEETSNREWLGHTKSLIDEGIERLKWIEKKVQRVIKRKEKEDGRKTKVFLFRRTASKGTTSQQQINLSSRSQEEDNPFSCTASYLSWKNEIKESWGRSLREGTGIKMMAAVKAAVK